MRSRTQHRRLANKAKDETALLKERITALASRDLPQRKELYELLEIVTAIAGDIEDAGDDLVNGFSRYKKGRHTFQGGGYLGDLKQKQQLIDKSKDLLGTPPLPPDGNGHGPAIATTPPPGDGVPRPIDVSTNGNQPQQQPQDQAKSGGKGTGSTGGKAGTAELQALEQRLVRLEHLVARRQLDRRVASTT